MPVIIAQILRQIIMAVATGAIITAGEDIIDGTARDAVKAVKDEEGLTEQEAKDIVGNFLADLAVNSALVLATLKAGVGVKAAEWLGLTTRGFTKKALTGKAAKVAGGQALKVTAKSGLFSTLRKYLLGTTPNGFILRAVLYANIGDWFVFKIGMMQDIFDTIFGKGTVRLPGANEAPAGFSNKEWDNFVTAVETAGIVGFNNEAQRQTQLYSREQLKSIMFYVYGQQILKGEKTTVTELQKAIQPFLIFKDKQTVQTFTPQNTTISKATSTPIKVFTGVVSQGVLGDKLVFTPRENDLIEDVAELNDSAHNNLVPFLTSLPSRVTYELKIVSSVVTSDGFRRVGTTQRVVTGTYANGQPKYKTVTNKFAVLDLFIKTSTGSRTKLSSIVLGPVDSARFQITNTELASLAVALQGDIVTTRLADVQNVSSSSNSSLQTNTSQSMETVTPLQTPGLFRSVGDFGTTLFARIGNRVYATNLLVDELVPNRATVGNAGKQAEIALATLQKKYQVDFNRLPAQNMGDMSQDSTIIKVGKAGPEGGPDPFVTSLSFTEFAQLRDTATVEYSQESVAKNATNLRDYFKAFGQEIPSIEVRGQQYESLGLGQAIYYTGTAEQNTKLLAKLQGK